MKAGIGTIPHPSGWQVFSPRSCLLEARVPACQVSALLSSFFFLPLPLWFVPQPFGFFFFFFPLLPSLLLTSFCLLNLLLPHPFGFFEKQLGGTQCLMRPGKQPFFLFLHETEPKEFILFFLFF